MDRQELKREGRLKKTDQQLRRFPSSTSGNGRFRRSGNLIGARFECRCGGCQVCARYDDFANLRWPERTRLGYGGQREQERFVERTVTMVRLGRNPSDVGQCGLNHEERQAPNRQPDPHRS